MWGFPRMRGTILGVPMIRTIVYWGLYWVPLILGNYRMPQKRRSKCNHTSCTSVNVAFVKRHLPYSGIFVQQFLVARPWPVVIAVE